MSAVKNEVGMWEIDIDGSRYEFEKWGAEDSMDALLDLAALVGKPLGMGVSAIFGKDEGGGKDKGLFDKEFDPNIIAVIMDALTDRISTNKATCKMLIKKFASDKVMCDGKRITFNTHYQDRLDHLFRVVKAALEVQYGNFFAAFLGASGIKIPQGIANRNPKT